MVYICGIAGFILGFALGLRLLMYWLHGRSNREILSDRSVRWTYGLFTWAMAVLGAWLGTTLYHQYFSG